MFPALQICISFRNGETKDIERSTGLIKISSELETKTHEYEPSVMLLFIQTLKYMTTKGGIKEVREWEGLQMLPHFFPHCMHSQNFSDIFIIGSSRSPSHV